MHKYCLLIITGFFSLSGFSQSSLTANPPALNFGVVYENAPDSLPVTLRNTLEDTLHIEEIRFYSVYDHSPFSSTMESFALAPGDSQLIYVTFAPLHNISHNTEMVVITDGNRGDLSINLTGQGKYSNTYYNSTENLSEEALKTALKTRLAQGYIQLSYNDARDEMYMNIDNQKANGQGAAVNTLECIYTGAIITGYTDRTNAQFMGFNTEHTWPQSFFSQNLPMRSDLFHLFPTKETANTQRSNLAFGVVTNVAWQEGGSERGDGIFEPRDAHKGNAARAMFYFVVRYQNYLSFLNSQEAILRQWHKTFLPTATDRKRNDDIFAIQNNRNPFIDYPQFIDRITSISVNSVAPATTKLEMTDWEINFDTVKIFDEVVYGFVIENTGNQAITLSNITTGDPRLTVENISGGGATIPAGDALSLEVRLNTNSGGSLNTTLDFSTNATGATSVSIPVTAEIIDNTAIGDETFTLFQVYPNPAKEEFLIQLSNSYRAPASYRVYDLSGRVVSFGGLNSPETTINLADWLEGMYIIQVNQGNQSFVQRVIVDR
ncbi:MAG: endonuclease [Bacteroidia bacterium]|nr:endonuclease [Bacteroidia bacterium]